MRRYVVLALVSLSTLTTFTDAGRAAACTATQAPAAFSSFARSLPFAAAAFPGVYAQDAFHVYPCVRPAFAGVFSPVFPFYNPYPFLSHRAVPQVVLVLPHTAAMQPYAAGRVPALPELRSYQWPDDQPEDQLIRIILRTGDVQTAILAWIENGEVRFVTPQGHRLSLDLSRVDAERTNRANELQTLQFRVPPQN